MADPRASAQEYNVGGPQRQAPPPLPFLPVPGTFAHEWLRDGSTSHSAGRVASDLRRAYAQFDRPSPAGPSSAGIADGTPPDRIFLEALSLSDELCFLTVLPNDPRIAVVHGLAVYAESFGAANPYQGRLLAFMGEREAGAAADGSPPPLLVAPMADTARVLFGSIRRRVARREALAAFYDDAAAREQHGPGSSSSSADNWSLLHPAPAADDDDDGAGPGTGAEEAFLPKLAYVPRRWAPYFLGGPSPYEALRVAEQLVRTTLPGNDEVGAAEPLLRWFRSACCRRSDAPHHAYRSAASVEWTPLLADHVSGTVRAWARERVGRLMTSFDSSSSSPAAPPGGDGSLIDGGSGVGDEGPAAAFRRRPPPPIVVAEDVGGGRGADPIVASGGMDRRGGRGGGNALVRSVSDVASCGLRDDDSQRAPGRQGRRDAMNASSNVGGGTRDVECNVHHERGGQIPPSNGVGPTRDVGGDVYQERGGEMPPSNGEGPTRYVEGNVNHEGGGETPPSNVEGPTRDVEGNVHHERGGQIQPSNVEGPTRDVEGNVHHERTGDVPRCAEAVHGTSTAMNDDAAAASMDGSTPAVSYDKKPAARGTAISLQQKPKMSFTRRNRRGGEGVVSAINVPPSVEGDAKSAFNSRNGASRIRVRNETKCSVCIAGRGHQDWDPRHGDDGKILLVSGTECDVDKAEKIILGLLHEWTQAKSEPGLGRGTGTPDKPRGRRDRLTSASKSTSAPSTGQRKRRHEDYEDAESSRYRSGDVRESECDRISPNSKRKRNAKSRWHKCFNLEDFFPCRGRINDRKIGRLIGRGGSKLDELMKVTGSTILVCSREMTIDISATNEEHFNNTVDYIKHFCHSLD